MKRRTVLRLAVGGGVAAMLGQSACSGPSGASPTVPVQPQPTPAPTSAPAPPTAKPEAAVKPAPTAAPPATPVRVVKVRAAQASPNVNSTLIYMAKEKGLDKQSGVDLEIEHFESSATVIKGMVAGEISIMGSSNMGEALISRAQGVPVKAIGVTTLGAPWSLGVRADRNINSLADLYGKVVGIQTPGTLHDILVRSLFAKEGLDADKLVLTNAGSNEQRFLALQTGKVDATVVSWAFVPALEKDPALKILVEIPEALPNYVSSAILATDAVIKQQPEIPLGYMMAQILGARYCVAHRDEAIALTAKLLSQTAQDVAPVYDRTVRLWAVNGHATREQVRYMQEINLKFKLQDKEIPIDDAVTWEFTDKAIAKLGKA